MLNPRSTKSRHPCQQTMPSTGLIAQSIRDPQLREAFDNRYQSVQHLAWAESQVRRTIKAMIKEARVLPDPDATTDHNAVVAAVRGSTSRIPPSPPPALGNLSNAQFRAQVNSRPAMTRVSDLASLMRRAGEGIWGSTPQKDWPPCGLEGDVHRRMRRTDDSLMTQH